MKEVGRLQATGHAIGTVDRIVGRPAINVIVSALVGAVFGYAVGVYQHYEEVRSKRTVLLQIMRDELNAIPETILAYQADKSFFRDPIDIPALPLLIDGELLEYPQHATILRALLNLNIVLHKYNDYVAVTNNAQATTAVPDDVHRNWYETMKQRHDAIRAAKAAVLSAIDGLR